ncbi:MAG: cysteine--tRNA ligase [Pseudomonadota bacterium]
MAVKFYDTETKRKREFVPLDEDCVTMYVCGITSWSYAHIGNARPAVVFDVLARLLRERYKQLIYVRNITDIDDKINRAAQERGVSITEISEQFICAYHEDMHALGVLSPDVEPLVTEHVNEIHEFIQQLIDKEHAYVAEGHVLFSVASYDNYGELSRRDPEELLAGARVDVAPFKRDAGDFVLWKPSTDDQPGWPSPWGRGRPGWHIECSAMSAAHLGKTIDIHGGGHDLVFPHHENERAQSVCAHGQQFVRYWMHNGFVNVDKEKMSKSLGNVLLVRDLLEKAPGEAVRYALLAAHYRAPLDWSDDVLIQAKNSLDRLYGVLRELEAIPAMEGNHVPISFMDALHDDLNTPKAMAELFSIAKQANVCEDKEELSRLKSALVHAGQLLGLLQSSPEEWFQGSSSNEPQAQQFAQQVESLIAKRSEAKAAKDWALADAVRDELTALGVVLEDGPQGTRWKRS